MKSTLMMICLALSSWAALAQHDHGGSTDSKKTDQPAAVFKDEKLGNAYEHYVHVKDALVASNSAEAKKGAGELQKSLKDVQGSTAAIEASSKISATSDVEEQRKFFSILSNEMAVLLKGGKLASGMLYLDYCPMANKNEGAFWLSNEKEIKNPYFGDKMLRCGGVKEMIH